MQLGHPKLNPTREHFIPQSQGGTGADIIMACLQCNGIKGDMMPEQWARFMEHHPKWWTFGRTQLNRARCTVSTPGIQLPARLMPPKPKPKRSPLVVPPELIWKRGNLIAATKAQDSLLRKVATLFPGPTEVVRAFSEPEATEAPSDSISAPAPHPGDLL
jgi:hypothetical protein